MTRHPVPSAVFLWAYSISLLGLAFLCAAGGHGVIFPFLVFFAPLSGAALLLPLGISQGAKATAFLASALLWPALGFVLRGTAAEQRVRFGRAALLSHYASAVASVAASIALRHENLPALRGSPLLALGLASICVYAFGQVFLWRAVNEHA